MHAQHLVGPVKMAEITPQGRWGNAKLFDQILHLHPAVLAQKVEDFPVPFVSEHERMRSKRAQTIKGKIISHWLTPN
jgi:hypothetical protein